VPCARYGTSHPAVAAPPPHPVRTHVSQLGSQLHPPANHRTSVPPGQLSGPGIDPHQATRVGVPLPPLRDFSTRRPACPAEVCPRELRLGEVRAGEVRASEVRLGEPRSGQVRRSGPDYQPTKAPRQGSPALQHRQTLDAVGVGLPQAGCFSCARRRLTAWFIGFRMNANRRCRNFLVVSTLVCPICLTACMRPGAGATCRPPNIKQGVQ